MKKYKFTIIIVLLFELLILINFNINIKGNIINPKISNLETDFQNPIIVENIDNNGGMSLYSLFNVKNQNDQYAYITLPLLAKTKWIRCTSFGFDLPDNSIIEGIKVQIDDHNGFFNSIYAQDIYLVLNEIKIGIDKESGTRIGTADTNIYRVYGSSTDIWNTELIQNDIESSTFGVQIFYYNTFEFFDVNIDNIQIKVYYYISELPEPETNIDFIIIFGLIGIFSIIILILMFSILFIKKVN